MKSAIRITHTRLRQNIHRKSFLLDYVRKLCYADNQQCETPVCGYGCYANEVIQVVLVVCCAMFFGFNAPARYRCNIFLRMLLGIA